MRRGDWDRPNASFKPKDYVLVKQMSKHTLGVPTRLHILQVVKVKDFGVEGMKGSDAARIKEQLKNIAHNSPPILDHNLYVERFYQGATMHCRVCGRRSGPRYMVLCDTCN